MRAELPEKLRFDLEMNGTIIITFRVQYNVIERLLFVFCKSLT